MTEGEKKTTACEHLPTLPTLQKFCDFLLWIYLPGDLALKRTTGIFDIFSLVSVSLGTGKRGHYERGLFTGGISRVSKISRFSRISRKWTGSHLLSTVWGFSKISKISRLSREWTFLKRPFSKRPLFSNPIQKTKHENPQEFRENLEQNSGQHSKIWGTFVLQLFWPYTFQENRGISGMQRFTRIKWFVGICESIRANRAIYWQD